MSRIDQIRKLLVSSPNDTFLLYSLGMEFLNQGDAAEALSTFERVLAVDENYLAAYTQAAAAAARMGDKTAARQWLQRGLELANKQADRHAADRITLLLEAMGNQEA